MKIAVLSGKGGAGKTLTAVNLAVTAEHAVYMDCDVEEPNGKLFLKPKIMQSKQVYTVIPDFVKEKCTGCRACVDFCRFHALLFIKGMPKVFQEACHACGGCALVCQNQAVIEKKRSVGKVEIGFHNQVQVVTGTLNLGEASGVPVIRRVLEEAGNKEKTVIVDCPPGSACSVMESITDVDYCILVAEPTVFGFHNFTMVHELAGLLGKPCGVVINKYEEPYQPLEKYCEDKGLPVLLRLPYDERIASCVSTGEILVEKLPEYRTEFQQLLRDIGGACL